MCSPRRRCWSSGCCVHCWSSFVGGRPVVKALNAAHESQGHATLLSPRQSRFALLSATSWGNLLQPFVQGTGTWLSCQARAVLKLSSFQTPKFYSALCRREVATRSPWGVHTAGTQLGKGTLSSQEVAAAHEHRLPRLWPRWIFSSPFRRGEPIGG